MEIAQRMLERQDYRLSAGSRAGVPRVPRAPHEHAALRARAQHPQRDRPRPPAPRQPPLRRGRAARARRAHDHRGGRHLRQQHLPEPLTMPRPIILGVVGDSAAGKTTMTRGLVRVLGEHAVTHACTDDYHRYDRKQRAELGITPLHPDCNYLDVMAQDLRHLRNGEPILKPVYRHADGTFAPPVYVEPHGFAIVEGLLGYHAPQMRDCYDVRVFLAPPEELRRRWKVQRDCSRRGYTTDEVLAELDRREPDSAAFIRPQERYADMVVSFMPGESERPGPPRRRADPPRPAAASGPFAVHRQRRARHDDERARPGAPRPHPGRHRGRARGRDRGGDLGPAALRHPPAQPAPGRVHDRDGPSPLGVAGARAAADPLPPRHRPRRGGAGPRGARARQREAALDGGFGVAAAQEDRGTARPPAAPGRAPGGSRTTAGAAAARRRARSRAVPARPRGASPAATAARGRGRRGRPA